MGDRQNSHAEADYFFSLNEALFRRFNARWDLPEPIIEASDKPDSMATAVIDLENRLATSEPVRCYWGLRNWFRRGWRGTSDWGWKDPRNTVTLPVWRQVFPDARIIHVCRNGVDVAMSLWSREKRRSADNPWFSERCLSLESAFELWSTYESAALQNTSGLTSQQYLRVRYEDLLRQSEQELERIGKFLGTATRPTEISLDPSRAYVFSESEAGLKLYSEYRKHPIMRQLGYERVAASSR